MRGEEALQVVQRVEDALSVDVYETNARLAIHEVLYSCWQHLSAAQSDSAEYNQCQSVLKDLFRKMPEVCRDWWS